ncbi:MAG: hypothetical protein OEM59_05240 [Rhodospirillales bacterium]|nr:hypothetical protein [Rhodospirillales bacterium]
MEDYELDLPAEAVVAWTLQAVKQGGSGLLANAWREYVADESFPREKGGYEASDVERVIPVGSLEVVPEHRPDSWVLRVRVKDELGDRLPADEDAPEGPEEIGLDQFWDEFMAPGRGMASIQVSAAGPADKEAFDRFLAELERGAERGGEG